MSTMEHPTATPRPFSAGITPRLSPPSLFTEPARSLAIIVTVMAGLVLAAGLYAAFYLPGTVDIATIHTTATHAMVTWVAPDGPAGAAGVTAGDTIRALSAGGHATSILVAHAGVQRIVLDPHALIPTGLDLLDTALGVCLLALGLWVRLKSTERATGAAYWRMCLWAGLSLALNPAGTHGTPWALVLQFVTLRLFCPALLALAVAFPGGRQDSAPSRWRSMLMWSPALLLLLLYPAYWLHPGFLASAMPLAAGATLFGYIAAACIHVVRTLFRPLSAQQKAQLRWLALGLVGGLLPFESLTLLPLALVGHALAPPEASILALALLPLTIAVAIVHTEFLGISGLLQRRALRILVSATLLAGTAAMAAFITTEGSLRWGWPLPTIVVSASVLTATIVATVGPRIIRGVEYLALHDVYNSSAVLRQMSGDLMRLPPHTIGSLAPLRLSMTLDLTDAVLLTSSDHWAYQHPRMTRPVATQEAVRRRMRQLLESPAPSDVLIEHIDTVPVMFHIAREEARIVAVLCLGPKRSGDCYTEQDQALVSAAMQMLALRLHVEAPEALCQETEPVSPPEHSHSVDHDSSSTCPALTECEMVILRCLAQCLPDKEIARRLQRDIRTVQKHNQHIYEKLGARTRLQAVLNAQQKHLLPPE